MQDPTPEQLDAMIKAGSQARTYDDTTEQGRTWNTLATYRAMLHAYAMSQVFKGEGNVATIQVSAHMDTVGHLRPNEANASVICGHGVGQKSRDDASTTASDPFFHR